MRRAALMIFLVSAAARASEQDEAAIRKLHMDYQAAFNAHDAKAEAALYTEDGDFVDEMGGAHGRAAVEKRAGQDNATAFKNASIVITPMQTRMIKPDVAITDGSYEIAGAETPQGKPMP